MNWWRSAPASARRALVAASLGWMLDAMDVLLYSFVLDHIRREFALSDRTSGLLIALPLASSALGGALFGWLADRIGRTRALTASIAVYSLATAACGLAQIGRAACALPYRARARYGRRVGHGRRARRRDLAGRAPGQGAWPDAERLGGRLRGRGCGQRAGAAGLGLARRVSGRRRAGAAHPLDPAFGRRVTSVAGPPGPPG